jgi:hypothetical protein
MRIRKLLNIVSLIAVCINRPENHNYYTVHPTNADQQGTEKILYVGPFKH